MVTNNSVKLQYPVTVGGVRHESLTLRRMKTRDTLVAEDEKNEAVAGFKLFAALADVDVEVILELDMDDLAAFTEVAKPLMGKQASKAMVKLQAKQSAGAK